MAGRSEAHITSEDHLDLFLRCPRLRRNTILGAPAIESPRCINGLHLRAWPLTKGGKSMNFTVNSSKLDICLRDFYTPTSRNIQNTFEWVNEMYSVRI